MKTQTQKLKNSELKDSRTHPLTKPDHIPRGNALLVAEILAERLEACCELKPGPAGELAEDDVFIPRIELSCVPKPASQESATNLIDYPTNAVINKLQKRYKLVRTAGRIQFRYMGYPVTIIFNQQS